MRIMYERSGGFGGLSQTLEIETTQLEPEIRQQIENALEQADVFNLNLAAKPAGMPDGMTYNLLFKTKDCSRSLHCSDANVPVRLRPLLQLLQKLAIEKQVGR